MIVALLSCAPKPGQEAGTRRYAVKSVCWLNDRPVSVCSYLSKAHGAGEPVRKNGRTKLK